MVEFPFMYMATFPTQASQGMIHDLVALASPSTVCGIEHMALL